MSYRVINIYYSVTCYTNHINSTSFQSMASMALRVFPDVACISQVSPPLTCKLGQAYSLLSVTAWKKVSPVSARSERLMFTQSNMDDSNFGVDEHNRTVLMDFSEIGCCPKPS